VLNGFGCGSIFENPGSPYYGIALEIVNCRGCTIAGPVLNNIQYGIRARNTDGYSPWDICDLTILSPSFTRVLAPIGTWDSTYGIAVGVYGIAQTDLNTSVGYLKPRPTGKYIACVHDGQIKLSANPGTVSSWP
jgi:hypothetical protein